MNLLNIAHVPPICVAPDATVMEAIEASLPARVGAVAVVESGRLVGIFTERDVMLKVVHKRLDPETTSIRAVMTAPVIHVAPDASPRKVLALMLDKHIRHLPISADGRTVQGMLSIRNILQHLVNDLTEDLRHLEAFIGADSPGG
jgi:CBS domain-containing protein